MSEIRGDTEVLGNDPAALETFRLVTETAPVMLWMGDAQGKCLFLNRSLREFWGVRMEDLATFNWGGTVHPEDLDALAAPFTEGMTNRTAFACEARYQRADGVWRWLRTEARPRFGAGGEFLGMIGVNTDVTDRKLAEDRQALLVQELNHRVKNLLAKVGSIAHQTARSSADLDAFMAKFSLRLQAMANTHALLTGGGWAAAGLREVLTGELSPYLDRIDMDGRPGDLRLSASAAVSMSLIVHELATNAAKYGALADPEGALSVSWEAEGSRASLTWRERRKVARGGPVVEAAEGFGTRLIRTLAEADLAGGADLAPSDEGFLAVIRFNPAGAVAAA